MQIIGTKERIHIRKGINSYRTGLVHQYGSRFFIWNTNMAYATSCENALLLTDSIMRLTWSEYGGNQKGVI